MKISLVRFLSAAVLVGFGNAEDGVASSSCSVDADCSTGEYCAANGVCLVSGSCSTLSDCDNPGNVFAVNLCIGTIYCIGGDLGDDATGVCFNLCEGTPSTCSSFDACAAADLEGDCCPTSEGKFLACCAGIDVSPTTVPLSRPGGEEEDTSCSSYPTCVEAGLTATVGGESVCCPNDDGEYLACCFGIESDTPEIPVVLPTPEVGSECSAYDSCSNAGLDGSCCPDDSGLYLTCCYGIDNDPEKPVITPEMETPFPEPSDEYFTFPDVDPGFGVDPPTEDPALMTNETDDMVDPGFGVDPPTEVDPGFGVDPPTEVDPGFGVDPPTEDPQGSKDRSTTAPTEGTAAANDTTTSINVTTTTTVIKVDMETDESGATPSKKFLRIATASAVCATTTLLSFLVLN